MTNNDVMLSFDNVKQVLAQVHGLMEQHAYKPMGTDTTELVTSKDLARRRADISRDLLYAAHLCDVAKVELMNQYHAFKGQDPPAFVTL